MPNFTGTLPLEGFHVSSTSFGAQSNMKLTDLKYFLEEVASAKDSQPSPLVGRLLSVVEIDQVAGGDGTGNGDGYCMGAGAGYTQSGGGTIKKPPPEQEDK